MSNYVFTPVLPPGASGEDAGHSVYSSATGAAAANFDWVTAMGANAPQGSVNLTVQSQTFDAYIRFKTNNPAAGAATTATSGMLVKAGGSPVTFKVNPLRHAIIDSIAPGGAGSIQVYVSSQILERNKI